MLTLTLPVFPRALVWSCESVQPRPPGCTVVDHDTVPHWDGMYDSPILSGQPAVTKKSQYLYCVVVPATTKTLFFGGIL